MAAFACIGHRKDLISFRVRAERTSCFHSPPRSRRRSFGSTHSAPARSPHNTESVIGPGKRQLRPSQLSFGSPGSPSQLHLHALHSASDTALADADPAAPSPSQIITQLQLDVAPACSRLAISTGCDEHRPPKRQCVSFADDAPVSDTHIGRTAVSPVATWPFYRPRHLSTANRSNVGKFATSFADAHHALAASNAACTAQCKSSARLPRGTASQAAAAAQLCSAEALRPSPTRRRLPSPTFPPLGFLVEAQQPGSEANEIHFRALLAQHPNALVRSPALPTIWRQCLVKHVIRKADASPLDQGGKQWFNSSWPDLFLPRAINAAPEFKGSTAMLGCRPAALRHGGWLGRHPPALPTAGPSSRFR